MNLIYQLQKFLPFLRWGRHLTHSSLRADAIAGLASAKCTNEENYVFQKFIRAVIGTNNVDHCARL